MSNNAHPTGAATAWSAEIPNKTGTYLVEYIGDWFPKGDINNVKHDLVDMVTDDGGKVKPLLGGRFLTPDQCEGWLWAKINPSGRKP